MRRRRCQSAACKVCCRGHWDTIHRNKEPPERHLNQCSAQPRRPAPPRLARRELQGTTTSQRTAMWGKPTRTCLAFSRPIDPCPNGTDLRRSRRKPWSTSINLTKMWRNGAVTISSLIRARKRSWGWDAAVDKLCTHPLFTGESKTEDNTWSTVFEISRKLIVLIAKKWSSPFVNATRRSPVLRMYAAHDSAEGNAF